jgi:membrane protein required for colicin V production
VHAYDIIMLAVLVMASIFGAWKGMAWQLASLASLMASGAVAVRFGGAVAPYISDNAPTNRFLAMLLLYLGTGAGIWLAFRIVATLIDRVKLREWDRQAGALFGAAKGALLCVVITFFAVTMSPTARQHVLDSRSGHYIAAGIDRSEPLMPPELYKVVGPYLRELDRQLGGLRTAPQMAGQGPDHLR